MKLCLDNLSEASVENSDFKISDNSYTLIDEKTSEESYIKKARVEFIKANSEYYKAFDYDGDINEFDFVTKEDNTINIFGQDYYGTIIYDNDFAFSVLGSGSLTIKNYINNTEVARNKNGEELYEIYLHYRAGGDGDWGYDYIMQRYDDGEYRVAISPANREYIENLYNQDREHQIANNGYSNFPENFDDVSYSLIPVSEYTYHYYIGDQNYKGYAQITDSWLSEHLQKSGKIIWNEDSSVTIYGTEATEEQLIESPCGNEKGGLYITPVEDYIYTGERIKPDVTVYYGRQCKELIEGEDYSVSFGKNIKAGDGSVTVYPFDEGYGKKKTIYFTIRDKIAAEEIEVEQIPDYTYTGSKIKPKIVAKFDGKILTEGSDYSLSYGANTNPGLSTVTINYNGIYTGSKIAEFVIKPKATTIKSLTSSAKASFVINWYQQTGASGYEVNYRRSDINTEGLYVVYSGNSVFSKKITSGLKSGKTYSVKIRAYKNVNGVRHYADWSPVKKIKTK